MNTFWASMVNMQRTNQWNHQYTRTSVSRDRSPGFGEDRSRSRSNNNTNIKNTSNNFRQGTADNKSTTSSLSRTRNNEENYGIWGKKSTQEYYQNRDSSPGFGN